MTEAIINVPEQVEVEVSKQLVEEGEKLAENVTPTAETNLNKRPRLGNKSFDELYEELKRKPSGNRHYGLWED